MSIDNKYYSNFDPNDYTISYKKQIWYILKLSAWKCEHLIQIITANPQYCKFSATEYLLSPFKVLIDVLPKTFGLIILFKIVGAK